MENFSAFRGPILIGISAVGFGLVPIFVIMTFGSGVNNFTLLFLRFFVASIFMFGLFFGRKLKFPTGKQILSFLLLVGIGYVGQSFCYFSALNYAPSSVVSLLLYTYPMLVMIGSVLVFKEQVTKKKVFGLLLALSGAFVIIGGQIGGEATGILLALSAAIIYTVYILVSSRVIGEGMGIQSSAFITLGATIVFGVMALLFGFSLPKTSTGWMGALLIAFASTVLPMWAFLQEWKKRGLLWRR
ncbi:DMT family transporter [Peptoniphilus sp. KCTC 25270]|uniref:DMT family transporter n=1 Tax=Peptoniphilus sp. KCTC 25270 TaxID=2897414 RepID=UPI001E5AEF34|nr:DMT family transporter [Peptoniphilus sp. KCTC 25270]MCD1147470.1 DMT family transporter [Peptoniphilus sp. KCTC 25270]